MEKLTRDEIWEIIMRHFNSVPISEAAQRERIDLIKLVNEVVENRKDNDEWKRY